MASFTLYTNEVIGEEIRSRYERSIDKSIGGTPQAERMLSRYLDLVRIGEKNLTFHEITGADVKMLADLLRKSKCRPRTSEELKALVIAGSPDCSLWDDLCDLDALTIWAWIEKAEKSIREENQ